MYILEPFVNTCHVKFMRTWEDSNFISFLIINQANVTPVNIFFRYWSGLTRENMNSVHKAFEGKMNTAVNSRMHAGHTDLFRIINEQ